MKSDQFKFIGFGFGGYLTAQYLSTTQNHLFNSERLNGVMLVNTYKHITTIMKDKFEALYQLYSSDD